MKIIVPGVIVAAIIALAVVFYMNSNARRFETIGGDSRQFETVGGESTDLDQTSHNAQESGGLEKQGAQEIENAGGASVKKEGGSVSNDGGSVTKSGN